MLSAVTLLAASMGLMGWSMLRLGGRGLRWWASLAGARTENDLASLFVFVSGRRMMGATALLVLLLALFGWMATLPLPVTLLMTAAGLALPRVLVHVLQGRWRRGIARQLPDALALWAGLLRAGQGTAHALAQVATRQAAPLGAELRMVIAQLRLGMPLEGAMGALCERAAVADMRLLAALLATHRELGGNLAESLQRLADLLRGRLLIEERIRSLTAQGRLQGIIVGLLPLLLLAVLYLMETEAMRVLHTTWYGGAALALILLLEVVGFVLIRRIVRIDA